jgi:hypothetical protein
MKQDWILEVLRDLTTFAQANAMPGLAEHLEDAQLLAAAEMERSADEIRSSEGTASIEADAARSGESL